MDWKRLAGLSALIMLALLVVSLVQAVPAPREGMPPAPRAEAPAKYLPAGFDLATLLPPAPDPGSSIEKRDIATLLALQASRTLEQTASALADVQLSVFRFSDVLGKHFSAKAIPSDALTFLNEALREAEGAIGQVKQLYNRPRPATVEAGLHPPRGARAFGPSYPSGHAVFGTFTALVLADMVPEKRAAIMARGWAYGWHRAVLGAHYPSDIEAGRIGATVIYALMQRNPQFQKDFARARVQIRRALDLPTSPDNAAAVQK